MVINFSTSDVNENGLFFMLKLHFVNQGKSRFFSTSIGLLRVALVLARYIRDKWG